MNPLRLICRAQYTKCRRYGNINPLSIAYATRLGLGPTNPEMITMAQETLLFRRTGFSPVLWLLIPTFSLPHAPPNLTIRLHRREERSSTTPCTARKLQASSIKLQTLLTCLLFEIWFLGFPCHARHPYLRYYT